MKKLLFICFLVMITGMAVAQTLTPFRDNNLPGQLNIGTDRYSHTDSSNWLQIGNMNTDRGLGLPVTDTSLIKKPVRVGTVIFQYSDKTQYIYNGARWMPTGGTGDSTSVTFDEGLKYNPNTRSAGVDTTLVPLKPFLQQNYVQKGDTTFYPRSSNPASYAKLQDFNATTGLLYTPYTGTFSPDFNVLMPRYGISNGFGVKYDGQNMRFNIDSSQVPTMYDLDSVSKKPITLTGALQGSGNNIINTILSSTGVSPGAYGDSLHVPKIIVGADGRVSSVQLVPVKTSTDSTGIHTFLNSELSDTTIRFQANDKTTDATVATPNYVRGSLNERIVVLDSVQQLNSLIGVVGMVAVVKDPERGGTFNFSSTGTADNGTSFSCVNGYFNRQFTTGDYQMNWYGLKSDGSDQSTLFNSVISALPDSATLTLPNNSNITIKRQVTINKPLELNGNNSRIAFNADSGQTYCLGIGSGGVYIHDLSITGADTAYNAVTGAIFIRTTGNDVSKNYYSGIRLERLNLSWCPYSAVYLKYTVDAQVRNLYIRDIAYSGIELLSASKPTVENCTVSNILCPAAASGNGYGLTASFTPADGSGYVSNNIKFLNNHVDSVAWEALDTHAGDRVQITGNILKHVGVGIAMVASALSGTSPKNIIISNNNIECDSSLSYAKNYAIQISGQASALATANVSNNISRYGSFDALYTQGLNLNNNTFYRPYGFAVFWEHDNYSGQVNNNNAVDAWSDESGNTGFLKIADSVNNSVTARGNTLSRGDMSDSGLTSINSFGIHANYHTDSSCIIGQNKFGGATIRQYDNVTVPVTYAPSKSSPNSRLNGAIGSLFQQSDASNGKTLWQKTTPNSSTSGWTPVGTDTTLINSTAASKADSASKKNISDSAVFHLNGGLSYTKKRVGINTSNPDQYLTISNLDFSFKAQFTGDEFFLQDYKTTGGFVRRMAGLADISGTHLVDLFAYGSGQTLTYSGVGTSYSAPWQVWKPNGNVGIGLTSPLYKLDVNGSINSNGNTILGKTEATTDSSQRSASTGFVKKIMADNATGVNYPLTLSGGNLGADTSATPDSALVTNYRLNKAIASISFAHTINTVTSTYTATSSDDIIHFKITADADITLPAAASNNNHVIEIVIDNPNAANWNLIDDQGAILQTGSNTKEYIKVACDSTEWFKMLVQ